VVISRDVEFDESAAPAVVAAAPDFGDLVEAQPSPPSVPSVSLPAPAPQCPAPVAPLPVAVPPPVLKNPLMLECSSSAFVFLPR
jgi:hypothetical protein